MYRFTVLLVAIIFLFGGFVWYLLSLHIGTTGNTMVLIPRNTPIVTAVDSINVKCKLPTPWIVALVARATARITNARIKSGWYVFTSDDTQLDILKALFTGKRRPIVKVTIPEGLTYREIAGLIDRIVGTDSADFVRWCESHPEGNGSHESVEGYLMPDTYEFYWKEEASIIGSRLLDNWQTKMGSLSASNTDVILASIVQAEAASVAEMPRIAGVYHNRLKNGMKLEADPTVQYGIGQKRRLLYEDLASENPWNTYRISGLPPTPINNPGYSALKAAMEPEQHAFLFFVSRGDSTGEHRFARTAGEHARNVMLYRRQKSLSKRN